MFQFDFEFPSLFCEIPKTMCTWFKLVILFVLVSSEVAEIVFNRCIKESGVNTEDENYQITLYYEFLEDVYSDWLDNDGTASETSSVASFSMEDETPEDDIYQRLRGKSAMEEAVKQLEEKKSHPLMIMVKIRVLIIFRVLKWPSVCVERWGIGFVQSAIDWQVWSKDFGGFEIFPSGIFRVGKFGKYIFGCLDLVGSLWLFKTIWRLV